MEDETALELAIVENVQREDLGAVEEARLRPAHGGFWPYAGNGAGWSANLAPMWRIFTPADLACRCAELGAGWVFERWARPCSDWRG